MLQKSTNKKFVIAIISMMLIAIISMSGAFAFLNDSEGVDNSFKISPFFRQISVSVQKTWDDEDNLYQTRSDGVTVQLYANNQAIEGKTAELNDGNSWQATFSKLDKYDANNEEIAYDVKEISDIPGYTASYQTEGKTVNITNRTEIVERNLPVSITVQKYKTGTTEPVENAIFSLYDPSDPSVIIAEAATDEDGVARFEQIATHGTEDISLEIKEKTAPSGYTPSEGVNHVTLQRSETPEVTTSDGKTNVSWAWNVTSNDQNFLNGTFTVYNDYAIESTNIRPEGTKTLSGLNMVSGDYSFIIKEGDVQVSTGVNDEEGNIVFRPIAYTADSIGLHTYDVYEVEGDNQGMDYDQSHIAFTVDVTDAGDGTLNTDIQYPDNGIVFHNEYSAEPTSISIQGTKILSRILTEEGETGEDEYVDLKEGMFTFQLSEVDENHNWIKDISQTTNKDDGTFVFDAIEYQEEGLHYYKITEIQGDLPGVAYDNTEYYITVNVTDDKNGKLHAVTAYPDKGIIFTNAYEAEPAVLQLTAEKILDGRDIRDGEFRFEVTENGSTVATGTNAGNNVEFTDISYGKPGSHTYKVKEINTSTPGITYDETEYEISVTVSDNLEEGKLDISTSDVDMVFNNSYKPEKAVVELNAYKTLHGRELKDGEFIFGLRTTDEVVSEAANDKEGNIEFQPLTFTEEGDYEYFVYEKPGNEAGITYDEAEFQVDISVKDDKNGYLRASVESPENGISFINQYDHVPEKAKASISGTKVLEGKDLAEGEFKFMLSGDGVRMPTYNNADGTFVFTDLVFDEAGDYSFTVAEQNTQEEGVTYDETVYDVIVHVSETDEGDLYATVEYEDDIVFTNTYNKPDDSGEDNPEVPDNKPTDEGADTPGNTHSDETVSGDTDQSGTGIDTPDSKDKNKASGQKSSVTKKTSKDSSVNSVKTGDETPFAAIYILLAASTLLIIWSVFSRRTKKKQ